MKPSFITRTFLAGVAVVSGAIVMAASSGCNVTVTPTCNLGFTECNGSCVNTQSDDLNCGGCGSVCPGTSVCSGGQCVVPVVCGAGLTLCGGYCVDTLSDPYDCGGCGITCAATDYCSNGTCVTGTCSADNVACTLDGECCSLYCASDGLCGCIPSATSGCAADSDCCSNICDLQTGVCQ